MIRADTHLSKGERAAAQNETSSLFTLPHTERLAGESKKQGQSEKIMSECPGRTGTRYRRSESLVGACSG
jgi:hypothetical protein